MLDISDVFSETILTIQYLKVILDIDFVGGGGGCFLPDSLVNIFKLNFSFGLIFSMLINLVYLLGGGLKKTIISTLSYILDELKHHSCQIRVF